MNHRKSKEMERAAVALGAGRRRASVPFYIPKYLPCNALKNLGVFDIHDEKHCDNMQTSFPCGVPGCVLIFNSMYGCDMHYESVHRYYCSQCKKQLRSPHLLDLHLSETHDSYFQVLAERKPMYACFVEECDQKFANPKERRVHCIASHRNHRNFRFGYSGHRKPTHKKPHEPSNVEPINVDGGSKESPIRSDLSMETGEVVAGAAMEPAKSAGFKSFRFGRGLTGGRSGWGLGFEGSKSPVQASTLSTSFVQEMLDSLIASEPSSM